jgi:hypothetical protein
MKNKNNSRIYYLITLNDDRWYYPKYRWWHKTTNECVKGESNSNIQKVKTIKKVKKVLRRLIHEGYKKEVFVSQRLKYIPGKGHLFQEYIYDLSKGNKYYV